MFSAMKFIWNATRGARLRPWRSEYIKWRIETYSGIKAESMTPLDILRFAWQEKWNLMRFLRWAAQLERRATQVSH